MSSRMLTPLRDLHTSPHDFFTSPGPMASPPSPSPAGGPNLPLVSDLPVLGGVPPADDLIQRIRDLERQVQTASEANESLVAQNQYLATRYDELYRTSQQRPDLPPSPAQTAPWTPQSAGKATGTVHRRTASDSVPISRAITLADPIPSSPDSATTSDATAYGFEGPSPFVSKAPGLHSAARPWAHLQSTFRQRLGRVRLQHVTLLDIFSEFQDSPTARADLLRYRRVLRSQLAECNHQLEDFEHRRRGTPCRSPESAPLRSISPTGPYPFQPMALNASTAERLHNFIASRPLVSPANTPQKSRPAPSTSSTVPSPCRCSLSPTLPAAPIPAPSTLLTDVKTLLQAILDHLITLTRAYKDVLTHPITTLAATRSLYPYGQAFALPGLTSAMVCGLAVLLLQTAASNPTDDQPV
ncbi:hypothetical protein IWQ60_002764 [Tieghemiomyces parasiticus]|uniref:Uncharacterized protein n=1 Tax=Tieghemiomyces parasiticus TaxID=78921 RepID=A0A9W8AIJ7_9FUNG|nr:hypothetical protein IWQ60_002764 [Tieghemiomyces parasiticus]